MCDINIDIPLYFWLKMKILNYSKLLNYSKIHFFYYENFFPYKVMGKNQLEEATKKAAREEKERIARIAERQKLVRFLH